MKTLLIETTPMPILSQEAPFEVEPLFDAFNADLGRALAIYKDKRFEVTGVAIKVGPDVHNKPSIEISSQSDPLSSDIGAGRIAHMDKIGIDTRFLSCIDSCPAQFPAEFAIPLRREANGEMSAATKAYPGRF